VWFAYDAEHWEGLPAVRVGSDRVRLSGVPYWVRDLNLGDEVRVVESAEGGVVAEERVHDSTNYTYRVVFDGADADDDRWHRLMRDLTSLDCWFDVRTPGFLAISVAAEHAHDVAHCLAARKRSELHYETGRT
jgi:hypothetical protein